MRNLLIMLMCLGVWGCGHVAGNKMDKVVDLGLPVVDLEHDVDGYFPFEGLDYDPRPISGSGVFQDSRSIRDTFEFGIRDEAGEFHALPKPTTDEPSFKSITEILVFVNVLGDIDRIEIISADHRKIAEFMKREYLKAYWPDVGMLDGLPVPYYYREVLTFVAEGPVR